MTNTKTKNLTVEDIEAYVENPDWLGYGYMGERSYLSDRVRNTADKALLRYANAQGWDLEHLNEWLNSKPGRHYGDLARGGNWVGPYESAVRKAWTIPTLHDEAVRTNLFCDMVAVREEEDAMFAARRRDELERLRRQ